MSEKMSIGVGADLGGFNAAMTQAKDKVEEVSSSLDGKKITVDLDEFASRLNAAHTSVQDFSKAVSVRKNLGLDTSDAEEALSKLKQFTSQTTADLANNLFDAAPVEEGLEKVEQSAKRTGEFLQKYLGRDVTQAQSDAINITFGRMQKGETAVSSYLKKYDSIDEWHDHVSENFATESESDAHKKDTLDTLLKRSGIAQKDKEANEDKESVVSPAFQSAGMQVARMAGGGNAAGAISGAGSAIAGMLSKNPVGALMAAPIMATVGAVAQGYGSAQQDAIETSALRNMLGAVTTDFDELSDSIHRAASGMGITYEESRRLTESYTKMIGTFDAKEAAEMVETSAGFGIGVGVDSKFAADYFGTLRKIGATDSENDNRRNAIMMGEAIARVGFGKADTIMAEVKSFASTSARASHAAPNLDGFAGLLSTIASAKIPGLTPSATGQMLQQADQTFRQGGGMGEASENYMLGIYQKALGSDFTAMQKPFLDAQGLFGSVDGLESLRETLNPEEQKQLDRWTEKGQGLRSLDLLMEGIDRDYGDSGYKKNTAIMGMLGVSAMDAVTLNKYTSQEGDFGGLAERVDGLVGKDGYDMRSIASIATAASGDEETLARLGENLRQGRGFTKLTDEESERLSKVEGSDLGEWQDQLIKLLANNRPVDVGREAAESIAHLDNEMTKMAIKLVPLVTDIRDVVVGTLNADTLDRYSESPIAEAGFDM
ncbi:MAG: hypothetical protein HN344_03735, partial [Gammaproteobacteria bacterium]|nr:hypothetical protein [Gammaproteobacteria bacterium]